MAKKKDFSNVVEDSFNDGYVSEPDVEVVAKEGEKVEKAAVVDKTPVIVEEPAAKVIEETITPPIEEAEQTASEEIIEETPVEEALVEETPIEESAEEVIEESAEDVVEEPEEELTESELVLKKLTDGDEEILSNLLYKPERTTYYLNGLQRACLDVKAREEALSQTALLRTILENYFSDAIKEAAKEEVVRKEIKKLKRQVAAEKKLLEEKKL